MNSSVGRHIVRRHPIAVATCVGLLVLAVALAVFLRRHLDEGIAGQLMSVEMLVRAPGASTFRVYWDDPERYPEAYRTYPVVADGVRQVWNVQLEVLPEANPAARHNELYLFSVSTPEQTPSWSDLHLIGDWSLVPDQSMRGLARHVAKTVGGAPNRLSATLEGSALTVVAGQSEYSGRIHLMVNGVSQIIDLYAEHWNLAELGFFPTAAPDYQPTPRRVLLERGRGQWTKLAFTTESGGPLVVERLVVDGVEPRRVDGNTFEVDPRSWFGYRLTGIAAVAVFLLLVSTIVSGALFAIDEPAISARWTRGLGYAAATSFAGFMAVSLTMVFYPGIFNEDTLGRWRSGMAVIDGGAPLSSLGTWFPPLMTLMMMAGRLISGGFALPTFVQVFFFYFCLGLISLDLFGRRLALVVVPVVAIVPTVVVHAVLLSPDTVTAIGLMSCALIIDRHRGRPSLEGEAGGLVLFGLSSLILFAFRHNSIALAPVLAGAIWMLFRAKPVRLAYLAVLLVGVGVTETIPAIIGAKAQPTSAVYLLWEHVGTLKVLKDRDATATYSLDGVGNTALAIAVHQDIAPDNLIHGAGAPFPAQAVVYNANGIRTSFFHLIRAHPAAFLTNRMAMYGWLLGVSGGLYRASYFDTHSVEEAAKGQRVYGFNYTRIPGSLAMRIEHANATFVEHRIVRYVIRPWFLLAAVLVAGAMFAWLRPVPTLWMLVTVLALTYYGTFFVLGAGAAFRYYFPSFLLLILAVLSCLAHLGRQPKALNGG